MVRLTAALVHLMDNDIQSLLEDGIALGFLGSDADLDTLKSVCVLFLTNSVMLIVLLHRTGPSLSCCSISAGLLSKKS